MKRTIATLACLTIGLVAASATAQKKGKTVVVKKNSVPITAKVKVKDKKAKKYTKKGSVSLTVNADAVASGACSPEGSKGSHQTKVGGKCTVNGTQYWCECDATVNFVCTDGTFEYSGVDVSGSCELGEEVPATDGFNEGSSRW